MKFIDLTGQTFGKLTVIKRATDIRKGFARWECRCSCGNTVTCDRGGLRNGNTKSCGCLRKELLTTHGKYKSAEYSSWKQMKRRCTNLRHKHFKDYGGRGICIYDPWIKSFSEFYSYIGPKPTVGCTIERINNEVGYFPGNVRWATMKEQGNNRRDNHQITYAGKTMNISQWATFIGIKSSTLYGRINWLKWPIEKALSDHVRPHCRTH